MTWLGAAHTDRESSRQEDPGALPWPHPHLLQAPGLSHVGADQQDPGPTPRESVDTRG